MLLQPLESDNRLKVDWLGMIEVKNFINRYKRPSPDIAKLDGKESVSRNGNRKPITVLRTENQDVDQR